MKRRKKMRIVMKPRVRRCLCLKCNCEFIVKSKKDWKSVKSYHTTEQIHDIKNAVYETLYYETFYTKCPVCGNDTPVYRRRID